MYAITIALYHKELDTNPERISKKKTIRTYTFASLA